MGGSSRRVCLLLIIALLSSTTCLSATGNDFNFLVFGGRCGVHTVNLYDPQSEEPLCSLSDIGRADNSPFASYINDEITVCGGHMKKCLVLEKRGGDYSWRQTMSLIRCHSSATTTFDFFKRALNCFSDSRVWTFFGGTSFIGDCADDQSQDETMSVWNHGEDHFSSLELGFKLFGGSCAVRKNQTHAIFSKGSIVTNWYQEEGNDITAFDKPPAGGESKSYPACGLTYHDDTGYQFMIAGGTHDNTMEVFNFNQNEWSEGTKLPKRRSSAAYLQCQNSFLLVGGSTHMDEYNDALLYDLEEGWVRLPMKLKTGDYYQGALRVRPGDVEC